MTTKDALHRIIEDLTEEEALDLLDYLNLQDDPVTLTEEELAGVREAEAEIKRGESVQLEDLKREMGW